MEMLHFQLLLQIVLSTEKMALQFLRKILVFQKTCFKVLKTLKNLQWLSPKNMPIS